uniref:Uncharacterized protein n=1 Tax=Arundo donax TaxID=35708 RepID=A0A0A9F9V3_ARUDO
MTNCTVAPGSEVEVH